MCLCQTLLVKPTVQLPLRIHRCRVFMRASMRMPELRREMPYTSDRRKGVLKRERRAPLIAAPVYRDSNAERTRSRKQFIVDAMRSRSRALEKAVYC